MSLIVACRFNDSITIVSDTRITNPLHKKIDHLRGAVVKTVIVNPVFLLSFAGDEDFAGKTIRAAFHWQELNQDEIVKRLLAEHRESNGETDFIAAFHSPTRLVVIKDGNATDSDSGWIGTGSERFHSVLLQSPMGVRSALPENGSTFWNQMKFEPQSEGAPDGFPAKMVLAMQAVIDDPEVPTVGGLPIIVVTQKNSFCFGEHVAFTSGIMLYNEFLGGENLPRQDANSGSCTVYFTSAQTQNVIFPVIYFLEAELGLTFGVYKNGTLHSRGIRSSRFDLLLWTLRDEFQCRVASHLPSPEELQQFSEDAMRGLIRKESDGTAVGSDETKDFKRSVIAAKPILKTEKSEICVCEPVTPSVNTIFLHLKSGQRMPFWGVFRNEVIKQSRIQRLPPGSTADAMAYLQYAPPFGDDRYVIEGESGLVDITFLVIRGEVTSLALDSPFWEFKN